MCPMTITADSEKGKPMIREYIYFVDDNPNGTSGMTEEEVVRCRECKWFEEYESTIGTEHYCKKTWCSPYDWANEPCFYVKPDDFCSYGERKDNEID